MSRCHTDVKQFDVRRLHSCPKTTTNKCSQANLPSNCEAPLCRYWLFGLVRLVYYFCGIMIRSDRFCSVCCGCRIDYVTQTWDDGVADASWSAKILVYGRYLPHLVALQTHTKHDVWAAWNPSHFWAVSAVFPTSLQPVMTSHQISFHLKLVVFKEDGESVKHSAASTSRCSVTHSDAPIIPPPTSFKTFWSLLQQEETVSNKMGKKRHTGAQICDFWALYFFYLFIFLHLISVFIVSELSSSGESVALTKPQDDSWKKKNEGRKRERKPLEKYLIHWASSAFVPQSDTVLMLKKPLCCSERCWDPPYFPISFPLMLSLITRLPHPTHPRSSFPHSRASCLPLILQIVSKACLCSISAKASPVTDQLQQNQLQAF